MKANTENIPVITIDGPSGSGKGTITYHLAQTLGWHMLDSGAIYRLLALAALKHETPLNDESALTQLAKRLEIAFVPTNEGGVRIELEEQDVTLAIRDELVGQTASSISAFAQVREALIDAQRHFRKAPGLIADGRDMGTIIFPDAALKFFLTASAEERAQRRYLQLQQHGINANLAQILDELVKRDIKDQTRLVAPLKPAAEAILIDTSGLSIDAVMHQILQSVKAKF